MKASGFTSLLFEKDTHSVGFIRVGSDSDYEYDLNLHVDGGTYCIGSFSSFADGLAVYRWLQSRPFSVILALLAEIGVS